MMGGGDSDESEEEGVERIMTPYNSYTCGIFMVFAPLTRSRFFKKLDLFLREKDI